jgi:lysophospholipase L1-like esterase
MIHKTDNQEIYDILTDTCLWRHQISNGDIIWSRQPNGSCISSFGIDNSDESIRYTRNTSNCYYIDDEDPNIILSNTQFESELIQFDKLLIDSKKQSIIFYGSSSIRFWLTLEKDFSFSQFNVINRGFGGSTLKQCYQQFKRIILPLDPRLLILYAGENDISEDQTPSSIQLIFNQFISIIRQFFPVLPIVYISIKPSPSRLNKLNEQNLTNYLIQEDIKYMNNIFYINIFNEMLTIDGKPRSELFLSDNLHMNKQGYDIWTQAIKNYLYMNGFISKGLINCKISFFIFTFNLLIFFAK